MEIKVRRAQVLSDEKQHTDLMVRIGLVQRKKVENTLNLLKTLGDMVTSSQVLGIPKKLFNFDFHDGHIGIGGLTSSVITCY